MRTEQTHPSPLLLGPRRNEHLHIAGPGLHLLQPNALLLCDTKRWGCRYDGLIRTIRTERNVTAERCPGPLASQPRTESWMEAPGRDGRPTSSRTRTPSPHSTVKCRGGLLGLLCIRLVQVLTASLGTHGKGKVEVEQCTRVRLTRWRAEDEKWLS